MIDNSDIFRLLVKRLFDDSVKFDVLKSVGLGVDTIKGLADKLTISEALVCYHIYGNKLSVGLLSMGLVDKVFVDVKKTSTRIIITEDGNRIIKIMGGGK